MVEDQYSDYYNKVENLIIKAERNADTTGDPYLVAWDRGDVFLIPAYSYSAKKHGCAEFIRYPRGYDYPHKPDEIFRQSNLPLW